MPGGAGVGFPDGVEADDLTRAGRRALEEPLDGQQNRRAAILQHEGESRRWVRGVHRNVGPAGFQDAQKPHDRVDRALDAETDRDAAPDSSRAEVGGEPVGPRVQLGIGDLLISVEQGDGARGPGRLRLEELMDAAIARVIGRGVVPLNQESAALRVTHEREGREAPSRVRGDTLEQSLEVSEHATHGGVLEEVGAVLEAAEESLVGLGHFDGQVELRGATVDVQLVKPQAGQVEDLPGSVLEDEHHLEQGRVAQAPRHVERLDDLLERHLLVAVGVERDLPHSGQELRKRRVAGQIGS
jgi:hypothetical protein